MFLKMVVFLIGSLLCITSEMRAQDSTFLSRAESSLAGQPVQEKVYLHLDKPNYAFGDTIWYKAYTVIGQKHQLSALSGVLYVELISPSDSLIMRQSIPLISGIGWSDIPLAHTLKQGMYRIRAYTRWMPNEPDYFYDQRIRIGGIETIQQTIAEHPDVQFFPEGGELVEGVRSRVAVKAINTAGLGEDIKGTIEDNSGNVVADFTTQHLGMGVFALMPEAGKSYKAKINIPGEATFNIDLPKAQEAGYTLTVSNNEADSIYLKIATNDKTLVQDKDKTFYIIAQNGGKVFYTTEGKLENTIYTAKAPKNRFPEGITQFTLFSQSGEPIAERIAFVDHENGEIKLSINTDNTTYTTRQKVKLDLTAKDSSNKPITGSFSIAVINESNVQPDENNESTILNNILLTSELKGYIEQPNYYFTNRSDKTKADLDILLLTQGYRRYEWKQILSTPSNVTTFLPELTQELSGILTTPGGKPIPNGKVTLVGTKQNLLKDTTADANGNFTFTNLSIIDTATLVLRARKENKGSNVKITPSPPDYPKIDPIKHIAITTDTTKTAVAKQQYDNYQKDQKEDFGKFGKALKTVKITGYKKPKPPEIQFSSNLHGPGKADQVIMEDKLGACVDLSDCLTGKVNGVIFDNGRPSNTRGKSPMSIIVDGITLNGTHLNDINSSDIYSIEVLRSGFAKAIYGSSIEKGGALLITMKHGGESTVDLSKIQPDGLITFPYTGFYKAKAFYTAKYEHKADTQPDMRTTVYWNPNILTDKDGNASLEYFNNDNKGTYRVVIEGIDDNGNIGRLVYKYKVE